jgi:hemerythrin-like domain-containing protein
MPMENPDRAEKPTRAHSAHGTEIAACSQHQCDKATALLSDEHRVIERVLAALEKLTEKPATESVASWRKALDFIRHFADQCHHIKEEKVLFLAMEAHGIPNEGGPIGMMLAEHEEGRSYVLAMFEAIGKIEGGDPSAQGALFENAKQYLRLLREHIQKEDDILFRMADEVIPEDEQRQLLKDFETHEAEEMGAGVHEKYLTIAEELESAA